MKLRDISVALPECVEDSATIAEWTGSKTDFIRDKIGIERRHFLRPGESGVDLAASACRALFERTPASVVSDLGLLIVVTQNPDFRLPHNSALLQDRLGLRTGCASFDINLGCSGYVYALSIAKSLMAGEGISEGLLVTVDPYSSIMGKQDRDTVTVFGDAATASWLSSNAGAEIGRGDFGTDGSGASHLIVKRGGAAEPVVGMNAAAAIEPDDNSQRLHMDGRAIFNFMVDRVPTSVDSCLARNNLTRGDIDLFVFHQASKFLLQVLIRQMNLDPARVPIEIEETGNTVSSSIPAILSRRLADGSLAGRTVLVCGFGVGLSWASNVLRFSP